jgi:hypothetical protein
MGQQKDSHFVVLIVEDDALTLMDAVEFVIEAGCYGQKRRRDIHSGEQR